MIRPLFVICVFMTLPVDAQQWPTFEVVRATYGTRAAQADVTERVRSYVTNESLNIQVNANVLGVDPVPNTAKTLTVVYRQDGLRRTVRAKDFDTLRPERVRTERFSTSTSGCGSLFGLSSGFRSSEGSGITKSMPNTLYSQPVNTERSRMCGKFLPIFRINSPSMSSYRSRSKTPERSKTAQASRVQNLCGGATKVSVPSTNTGIRLVSTNSPPQPPPSSDATH